jgi:hypothetical protein
MKNKLFKLVGLQLILATAVVGLQPQPRLCQQNALPAKPGIRNGCECAGGDEGVCEKYETTAMTYYRYSQNACDGIKAVGGTYRGRILVYQAPCLKLPICGCPDPSSTRWVLDRIIDENAGTLFESCVPGYQSYPCYPTIQY